jgi:hypothetical protein
VCLPCQNHLASKESFPCQNRSLPRRALIQSKWRLRSPILVSANLRSEPLWPVYVSHFTDQLSGHTLPRQPLRQNVCSPICGFRFRRALSSHMILPRRPFQPVLRNSGCVEICPDRLSEQVTIVPRCGLPLPDTRESRPECDPWEWSEKPHSWYLPQSGSPDKHDADPAFPSCLSQSRPLALS